MGDLPGPRKAGYMLKAAVRHAVTLAGGVNFVSQDLGISAGYLSKCHSPVYSEQHLRMDLVPPLEEMAGSPVITETLAKFQTFRLVRGDDLAAGNATLADLARILSQVGHFSTCFATALEDRIFDAHERRETNSRIEDLIRELRNVQSKVNGEGG